jgi:hypothetical protein
LGVEEEDEDIEELDNQAWATGGYDEKTVEVHNGESIKSPHHAIDYSCNVWNWRELLHWSLLPYPIEGWPVPGKKKKKKFLKGKKVGLDRDQSRFVEVKL